MVQCTGITTAWYNVLVAVWCIVYKQPQLEKVRASPTKSKKFQKSCILAKNNGETCYIFLRTVH